MFAGCHPRACLRGPIFPSTFDVTHDVATALPPFASAHAEHWSIGTSPRKTPVVLKLREFATRTFAGRATATVGPMFMFLLLAIASAHAVEPSEILKDPKLEARAREISQKLRCVVCQNQSIDDFKRATRQGFARAGARTVDGRRYGSTDPRLHRRALRQLRAFEATDAVQYAPALDGAFTAGRAWPSSVSADSLQRQRQAMTTAAEPPLSADEQTRVRTLLEPEVKAALPAKGNAS